MQKAEALHSFTIKSLDLMQLKFLGKLFVSDSMCHENHHLAYKCCQLKSACKIHSTFFQNSALHVKLVENGPIHKIFHPTGSFFLLQLLCISINLPYTHAWYTVVMSGLVPLVITWNCQACYKDEYVGLQVLRLLHLLNPWLIVEMWPA